MLSPYAGVGPCPNFYWTSHDASFGEPNGAVCWFEDNQSFARNPDEPVQYVNGGDGRLVKSPPLVEGAHRNDNLKHRLHSGKILFYAGLFCDLGVGSYWDKLAALKDLCRSLETRLDPLHGDEGKPYYAQFRDEEEPRTLNFQEEESPLSGESLSFPTQP